MYAKIEDGRVIFPPHNDGNKINVHLDPVWLEENGFIDMSQEEIEKYLPKPPENKIFTKLSIRRAMRNLGIESKLDEILNSSEVFKSDWNDAQEINLDDPVYKSALNLGGITDEEIKAIIDMINSGGLENVNA